MCSIDDGEPILKIETYNRNTKTPKCMKCKINDGITIIRIHDAMCRDCFIKYATHKFRSSFGKSRLVRDGQKVVIAFSGGQASCSMLHLITEGLSKRAQKKLRFIPILVFIDDSSLLKTKEMKSIKESVEQIKRKMQDSQLENYSYKICQAYQEDLSISPSDDEMKLYEENLENAFKDCKTLSAKEHLLSAIRENLLISVTRLLTLEMLFIGDTLTRLAERTLVSMVIGDGANSFSDTKHQDVMIIRPLRMFSSKEIATYNHTNKVEACFLPTISTMVSIHKSIGKLSESFVSTLSSNSATIISTICRTAEKLKSELKTSQKNCELCKCAVDVTTDMTRASAHGANTVSTLLSSNEKLDITAAIGDNEMTDRYCYACTVFLRDMNSKDYLPIYKRHIVSTKEIEEELSEFILRD